eukprot:g1939.t1
MATAPKVSTSRQALTAVFCCFIGFSIALSITMLYPWRRELLRGKAAMQWQSMRAATHMTDAAQKMRGRAQSMVQLPQSAAEPRFVAEAVTPEFLQAVSDFSIVITWVNGSDPNYMAHREVDCKKFYTRVMGRAPASMCDPLWRLARVRNMGEILFLIRSIETNLPWFKGTIFLVMDDWTNPPFYFDFDKSTRTARVFGKEGQPGPELRLVRHSDFIPKEFLPTYSIYAIIPHLHRIKGVAEVFAHIEDDNIVGRALPPTAFITPFGGPQLYFERSSVTKGWCKSQKKKGVWLASMCRTLEAFISMHPGMADKRSRGSFGHYIKHAPIVYKKSVLRQIVEDPKYAVPGFKESLQQKFRTGPTIQSDSIYAWHMIARGGTKSDSSVGVAYGFRDEMRLILLNDRTGMKKLDAELGRFRDPGTIPMFFTINDDGWTLCDVGKKALLLLNEVLPEPSRWERRQERNVAKVIVREMRKLRQCLKAEDNSVITGQAAAGHMVRRADIIAVSLLFFFVVAGTIFAIRGEDVQFRQRDLFVARSSTLLRHAAKHLHPWHNASPATPHNGDAYKDLSFVITWVNGSDPNYMKHREVDCKRFFREQSGYVPTGLCDTNARWRLARVRTVGEILFNLRSIQKNMPWFRGTIYFVMDDWSSPPSYFDFDKTTKLANVFGKSGTSGPKLRLVRHSEFIPKAFLPTYSVYAIVPHLHRISGITEMFAHIEDDLFVMRYVSPEQLISASPEHVPRLMFEKNTITRSWCKSKKQRGVWINSMCKTLDAFLHMHPRLKFIPQHYIKHAPLIYNKTVIGRIIDDSKMSPPGMALSLHQKFRSSNTLQTDSIYAWHMIAMGDAAKEFATIGHNNDFRLLMLNDRHGMKRLESELARVRDPKKRPVFITVNDDGWTLCAIGGRALHLLNEAFPKPSMWERQQIGNMAEVLMTEMQRHGQCRKKGEKPWKNIT